MTQEKKRLQLMIAFGLYCLAMVVLLFVVVPFDGMRSANSGAADANFRDFSNFIPFGTIVLYLTGLADQTFSVGAVIALILGNLALAIPLGAMLPALFERMRWMSATIITAVAANFVLEFFQLMLRIGSFDIDCLILRGIGAAIGFLLWRIFAVRAAHN